jgi:hypothetical protein
MSIVSPFHDACAAGCLANASLNASAKPDAPANREAASFAPSPIRPATPAPQVSPRHARWRRLATALVSLVSGPTLPRA